MEKIDIVLAKNEDVQISFAKKIVVIDPYISIKNKLLLLQNYMDAIRQLLQYGDIKNYITAEYGLILGIIDIQTNIDIESIDIEDILSSGLWDVVRPHIANYSSIRTDIDQLLKIVVANDSPINQLLKKVIILVENFSNIDTSEEGLKKLITDVSLTNSNLPVIKKTRKTKKIVE